MHIIILITPKNIKLLLGYWVNLYLTVLFDRWSMVKEAVKNRKIKEVCVIDFECRRNGRFQLRRV